MKLLASTAMLVLGVCIVYAQGPTQYVQIIARRVPDGVILRWAPTAPAYFAEGREGGYTLERATVDAAGRIGPFTRITLDTADVFRPFEEARFNGLALDFRNSDSMRIAYRTFAHSVLYEQTPNTLSPEQRAEALAMQYGFAMLAADRDTISALGLGLQYNDESVRAGQRYAYRIGLASRPKEPAALDTVLVDANEYRAPNRTRSVVVDTGDTEIALRWPTFPDYSATMVQRSTDNGRTWLNLADAPMLNLVTGTEISTGEVFRDSGLVNYRVYKYRVLGYTAFADEELISEVTAMPRDKTPPDQPTEVRAIEIRPGVVRVTWQMPEPVSRDLRGFYVGKDSLDEGKFPRISRMLPATQREYIDSASAFYNTNYYAIEAIDTAGNTIRSFSAYVVLIDSTPPAAPELLSGQIDSNGVATIRFNRPADRDYMGYRLLRANDSTHEFTVVHERLTNDTLNVSNETSITDTVEIRTLTRYVYYRMYALDFHHNRSEISAILQVERPDVVPPVSPVITGYLVTDSSVIIDYVSSSSEDVARHLVLRRVSGTETWDSIAALPSIGAQYEDTTAVIDATFDYALQAVDQSGLRSEPSNEITCKRYDTGVRPPAKLVTARYDSTARVVEIGWTYSDLPEDLAFVIYRADGEDLVSYAVVADGKTRSYVDRVPPRAASVRYAIKVVTASGAESVVSEPISIDLR